jgi:DNA-directed RNA polymerase specialized sigma24 family protein
MGIDVNSVGVLIHRARSRLRELLADLSPTRTKL